MANKDGTPSGPKKGTGGRNTFLETGIRQQILDAIAAGMSEGDACRLAGTSDALISVWKKRSLENGPNQADYLKFVNDMAEARLKLKFTLVTTVTSHATRDGRLALEVLRRRHPEEWGVKSDSQGGGMGDQGLLTGATIFNFNQFLVQRGGKAVNTDKIPMTEVMVQDDQPALPAPSQPSSFAHKFKKFSGSK